MGSKNSGDSCTATVPPTTVTPLVGAVVDGALGPGAVVGGTAVVDTVVGGGAGLTTVRLLPTMS